MSKFEQIKIGDKAQIKHVITESDIRKFVELTGDDNKLHIDKSYAEKTSFKQPVAHGMLGASFISTIIGTKIPGDGALWFSQNLEFLLPVRVGDEITIIAEVTNKVEKLQIVELSTDIYNQHKQKVTSGTAKVKVVEQETEVEQSGAQEERVKNVLVIGATGGIGNAVCDQLAAEGYNIAIHYNSNEAGAKKIATRLESKGIKTCIISGDITKPADAQNIISATERKLGPITVYINCASSKIPNIKFDKMEWEDIEKHINVNIKGNFYLLQKLLPGMKERRSGKVILITTQATESTPPSDWLHYVSAKSGLNGFAKSLAVEMAPFNIQVNLVSPGMTETELISDIPEKTRLLVAAKTPLRRLGKAEDIAQVVSFLASSKSNYLTGETIRVNGGQSMM